MAWLSRFRAVRPGEVPLLAESWVLFAWLDLSIRFRGYERWRHWLDPAPRPTQPPLADHDIDHLIRLSERIARHHWAPMNCLRRSLVQQRLLASRGVDATLHIGVRAAADKSVEAHAWLSHRGRILNDTPENVAAYQVLEPDHWGRLLV